MPQNTEKTKGNQRKVPENLMKSLYFIPALKFV